MEHGPKVIRDAGLIDRLSGLGRCWKTGNNGAAGAAVRYVTLPGCNLQDRPCSIKQIELLPPVFSSVTSPVDSKYKHPTSSLEEGPALTL